MLPRYVAHLEKPGALVHGLCIDVSAEDLLVQA